MLVKLEKKHWNRSADYEIQPSEHGLLSYIIGYLVSKLNEASKGNSGEEKPEIHALLQSLIVSEEEISNEFISARTRGGVVTPCEDIVRILHEAEICFRKEVNKTGIIRNIAMPSAFRLSACPLLSRYGKILCCLLV